mmetsp:Transcript_13698/g.12142  ORF Transcript_13698/g.12142 Transcript_13698/m.12142 type:complete len:223 (+) Transcript_13698:33-701(+)
MISQYLFSNPTFPERGHLPIGHNDRPSAFAKCSGSIISRKLSEFSNKCLEVDECISTINSDIVRTTDSRETPEYNSMVEMMEKQSETKEDIIAEFMEQLEAPSTKIHKKCASKFTQSHVDYNTSVGGSPTKRFGGEESYTMNNFHILLTKSSGFSHLSRPKIGFYTQEERKAKIYKYRAKIQKWKLGEHKNRDLYYRRRKIAKDKKRVGGKFVKQDSSPTIA